MPPDEPPVETSSPVQPPPPLPQGPGLARQAANFGKAVIRHVANGCQMVTDEVREQRLATCRTCPACDLDRMVCRDSKCGCRLEKKAGWASEACPQGKWDKVSEQR